MNDAIHRTDLITLDARLEVSQTRNPVGLALAEIERMFREMVPLFKQDLPVPSLTLQTRGRRSRTVGWFGAGLWQKKSGDDLAEINIVAEWLVKDVFEIAETLLHEMVHYANHLRGIDDCKAPPYHNSHFKKLAEEVGLVCGPRDEKHGFGYTSLSPVGRRYISEVVRPDPEAFAAYRREFDRERAKPSQPKLERWLCGGAKPGCVSVLVAAKSILHATCGCCGGEFRSYLDLKMEGLGISISGHPESMG